MNDLDDNPWDIMMYQMDEAILNVGTKSAIFDPVEKVAVKEFWQIWGITSWNNLHEHLTDIQKAQKFIKGSLHVDRSIFNHIDPQHPGHITISTIVAFGPYNTAHHISALKGGESDIPINNYRYFGDMAFCRK